LRQLHKTLKSRRTVIKADFAIRRISVA
jgi:hypothetical protein